jgi:amphiphysin
MCVVYFLERELNIYQAQKEHEETKEVYEFLNDQLISELPQLLDLRIPFFDPSFEAMIRIQCKFAEEGYEKMGGVQRYFQDSVRNDYAAGQLDAQVSSNLCRGYIILTKSQVETVLEEIKELTICATHGS